MRKTLLTCAAMAAGLAFTTAPAMALEDYECHIPQGAHVQLKKGNVAGTVKILAGANTNQGNLGEILYANTHRVEYRRSGRVYTNIRCFLISDIELPEDEKDVDLSVGDAFDFDEDNGYNCRERRSSRAIRQSCHVILSDPGNSDHTLD